jgi:hypothetical protein
MILYHNETSFPKPHLGDALRELTMANTHETDEITQPDDAGAEQKQPPKKSGKIIGAAKWVLAVNAWKRHAGNVKNRASFPLLRQVVKNSSMANKIVIPTEIIDDVYVAKSIVGHRIIMWSSMAVCCYFLTIFAKGLAVAIKFGDPWNTWLLSSIPMILFTSFRALFSYKLLGAFVPERDMRLSKLNDLPQENAIHEAG